MIAPDFSPGYESNEILPCCRRPARSFRFWSEALSCDRRMRAHHLRALASDVFGNAFLRAIDNLIRSVLLSIPLLLIYYWNAAAQWRFEWVSRPTHLRIWNAPGGCLPMDHYP